ncbi:hypothetical protein FRC03_008186, partial [Tulasnella sp. 419]
MLFGIWWLASRLHLFFAPALHNPIPIPQVSNGRSALFLTRIKYIHLPSEIPLPQQSAYCLIACFIQMSSIWWVRKSFYLKRSIMMVARMN